MAVASCEECGGTQFENLSHEYYAACWSLDCADCGATLTVHEAPEQSEN